MEIFSAADAEALVFNKMLAGSRHDFVIMTERTQERDFGWVVFYTTRQFAESGNPSHLVPGVGPVAVTRPGEVVPLATSLSPAAAIAVFETEWRKATAAGSR